MADVSQDRSGRGAAAQATIAAGSIAYGMQQLNKAPEIGIASIFQGLAINDDNKGALFALIAREGQPCVKLGSAVSQQIERSVLADSHKALLRALYQFVTKECTLNAVPGIAQLALDADMASLAFDATVLYFGKLRKTPNAAKSETVIAALDILGKAKASGDVKVDTFQFQRTMENAIALAAQIQETYFKGDSRFTAAVRRAEAIVAGERISSANTAPGEGEKTAYDAPARSFDYNGALQRLKDSPTETGIIAIEEALAAGKVRESDRFKVLSRALACFSGDQITPQIARRQIDLKLAIDTRRLQELDGRLSQESNPALQSERDQLAQQLYENKIREFGQRLHEKPDDIKLRIELAETLRSSGNLVAALATLQDGARNTMDAQQRKSFDVMLGDLFFARGQYRIALRAYDAVVGDVRPETLVANQHSLEFSALVKLITTLAKLSGTLKEGDLFRERALNLIEPLYLLCSETHSEVRALFDQLTQDSSEAPNHRREDH